MPKLTTRLPKLRHHKASGQAIVTIAGADHYCGRFGSKAAQQKYDRLVSEWIAAGRQAVPDSIAETTISELLAAFLKWAAGHYVKAGKPTAELDCLKSAARYMKGLYGPTPVASFGPLAAKAVRQKMIGAGWSRGFVNRCMGRVKRILRWGVENELVPAATYNAVKEVAGLQAGRTEAIDHAPRRPVPQEHIDAVRAVCRQRVKDLIDLMLLTAARPSELLGLTWAQIDTTGAVWIATLESHKMMHKGRERRLYFGPQAQLILGRYSKARDDLRLFRPTSLRDCIVRACERAQVPRWTPYQLRHTAATRFREQYGLEAAQVLLGHARADVTQIYAQKNEKLAREVAANVG